MEKRKFLFVMAAGILLAIGIFAGQLKAADIILVETTPVEISMTSIYVEPAFTSCDPVTGYAAFNVVLDGDALRDGASAFGPWEIHLIPKGGAKANCFADASTLKASGTFLVTPESPSYRITYNWSGWSDLDNLESAYAMTCATLDTAYSEVRKNIPVSRESIEALSDGCIPTQF